MGTIRPNRRRSRINRERVTWLSSRNKEKTSISTYLAIYFHKVWFRLGIYEAIKSNRFLKIGIDFNSKCLSFRLVAGVWILAAFIFVQAYTSILFTYIVTPVNTPLMNSVYDISENSHINVFIKMAGISDTLLSASSNIIRKTFRNYL